MVYCRVLKLAYVELMVCGRGDKALSPKPNLGLTYYTAEINEEKRDGNFSTLFRRLPPFMYLHCKLLFPQPPALFVQLAPGISDKKGPR